jgi:Tfp pilus tip-associated adhesin PilY1
VVTAQAVDWAVKNGWYIDFTGTPAGERLNVDMVQTGKLLGLATNQPEPSACNSGGNSVLYFFDITTGNLTDNALTFTTLTAGLNLILIGETLKIIRFDTVGNSNVTTPTSSSTSGSTVRRTSWRELAN